MLVLVITTDDPATVVTATSKLVLVTVLTTSLARAARAFLISLSCMPTAFVVAEGIGRASLIVIAFVLVAIRVSKEVTCCVVVPEW